MPMGFPSWLSPAQTEDNYCMEYKLSGFAELVKNRKNAEWYTKFLNLLWFVLVQEFCYVYD